MISLVTLHSIRPLVLFSALVLLLSANNYINPHDLFTESHSNFLPTKHKIYLPFTYSQTQSQLQHTCAYWVVKL